MTAQQIPAGGVYRIPPYDARTGDHYWAAPFVFHISDPVAFYEQPDGPMQFDLENLVLAGIMGCYYCEEPYSEQLRLRRCKGNPR